MKKFFTRTAYGLLFCFLGVFAYANLTKGPITDNLKRIDLAAYNLSAAKLDAQQGLQVSQSVHALKGVTACTYNPTSQLLSVTYYPTELSKANLQDAIKSLGISDMSEKVFEKSGKSCPVHAYIRAWNNFFYCLRVSNWFK